MLISEELFLLLTTPKGSPQPWVQNQNTALGGALLADLIADAIGFARRWWCRS